MARRVDSEELGDAFDGWSIVAYEDTLNMECADCGAWVMISCPEGELLVHADASTVLDVVLGHACGEPDSVCKRHEEETSEEAIKAMISDVETFLGRPDE